MASKVLLSLSLLAAVRAQQVGTNTAEVHPSLPWQKCTKSGGCTTQSSGKIVLDANWRWVHTTSGYTNCYTGQKWDSSLCPDPVTCAQGCAVDGADYQGTYGITTSGNALTLKFVTSNSNGKNIGSRVYLMADDSTYQMFKVKNQEFTFDVDVSQLPCGLNGALYFSAMDADGGLSKYPNNKAGAKYGTGYCDAQCPRDIKFINGEANVLNWTGASNDANSGTGRYGTCCDEMDVWEANSISTAYTPHPCSSTGQTRCDSSAGTCASTCDQAGCDFNSYRMGVKNFYGPGSGFTIDTTKKITVVTQFITADGTAGGALSEIRRLYVQNGVVVANSKTNISGMSAYDSVSDAFCSAQKTAFSDANTFSQKGGLGKMSKAFDAGMVLVLSIWDDHTANMLWLDSNYPTDLPATQPGVARGTCATTSGVPADLESQIPNAQVVYSNIRFGDIGSTYTGTTGTTTSAGSGSGSTSSSTTAKPATTSTSSAPATTTTASTGGAAHYAQCGGIGWTGPTTCVSPYTCVKSNDYYSQCL
ncbi:beta-1,4-D-glucan cellobiohydrolase [Ceratobasidium sp. AG-Ba]|nr:beta-1,4-D-glucan cellobiohydrolase [Ceratobasidium sp. AG-Ba]QRV72292.1 beta-1,4-D-glucan cellobiohydrolase [Ceratobasidium sp. AG-Ba]QRW01330.1 beta-1,4-D-glucan cellobiohydrolase [Ceratobasidium sp. AG-Ba]QRW01332.1 beta-1,4-D-glucan cellobiohydrolase [Ceratobasidium sp. AG-Ba]